MALFKKIVLLGAAVALLPTDQTQQQYFYERAAGAVRWTATFCDRNPAVCAEGQAVWATLVKKAEFGAGVISSLVQQQFTQDTPPTTPAAAGTPTARGTLRPADLQPVWRGAAETPRRGI